MAFMVDRRLWWLFFLMEMTRFSVGKLGEHVSVWLLFSGNRSDCSYGEDGLQFGAMSSQPVDKELN